MRTIAIINQKGGCGKTTVSINLAAAFAHRGKRTLLLDMDAQSHCALGLSVPEAQINHSVTDLMQAGMDGSVSLVQVVWQISRYLDLAPSTMDLSTVEQQLAGAVDRDIRLAQVLATVEDRYDVCVIDCPPALGLLTFNAFRAADEVIVPVETGYFALRGSMRQQQTMNLLAERVRHAARFSILPTMYDVRTKLARELMRELKEQFGEMVLPVTINYNTKLKEASSFGQPIFEYDAKCQGMQDFDELCQWLTDNPPKAARSAFDAVSDEPVADPTRSRAMELVERARALSGRTGAVAKRFHQNAAAQEASRNAAVQAAAQASEEQWVSDRPPSSPQHMPPNVAKLGPMVPRRPRIQPMDTNAHVEPQTDKPRLAESKLAALTRLYGVRRTAKGLLFVQPANAARSVAVTGDFNNWQRQGVPLKRDERLGLWQTAVDVPPGRYRYRLVIDGQASPDPYNKQVETSEQGEMFNYAEVA